MNESLENQWQQYIEIPRRQSEPVKLDEILAQRMRTFIRARKVKPLRIK